MIAPILGALVFFGLGATIIRLSFEDRDLTWIAIASVICFGSAWYLQATMGHLIS